jgi:hypothetical protein
MLAHSPPLPLVIDYRDDDDITAEDEEAIIVALEQRDRVRRIRLDLPVLQLQKLIMAIDGEYPILEYLILADPPEERSTVLILPETLQTPHLRHLTINCTIPIRFQLLTTAAGLVALNFALFHPSTYFQPTVLLQCTFIDAPAGDPRGRFSLPCSQPRCGEATHAHSHHDTRHAF